MEHPIPCIFACHVIFFLLSFILGMNDGEMNEGRFVMIYTLDLIFDPIDFVKYKKKYIII